MNKLFILNANFATREEIGPLEKNPKFRKATPCMLMAYLATHRTLEPFGNKLDPYKEAMGLFLGTGHGELEATMDFLKRLKGQGLGGPIFFQNSLHNSTTGYLTQRLRVHGVSLTTSNGYFSGENALDLAALSLEQKKISLALVVGVDALPPELQAPMARMYPVGLQLGEGAGALLLGNFNSLKGLGAAKGPWALEAVQYSPQPEPLPPQTLDLLKGYFDSNFISLLAQEWSKENIAPNMVFHKPDGTHSKVTINRDF